MVGQKPILPLPIPQYILAHNNQTNYHPNRNSSQKKMCGKKVQTDLLMEQICLCDILSTVGLRKVKYKQLIEILQLYYLFISSEILKEKIIICNTFMSVMSVLYIINYFI